MTFDITLMRPGGGFIAGVSTVAAAQLNYITASLANALDPIGGGTFTNTTGTQIILNGDKGFKFDYSAGPGLEIAGTVGASILNGSFLTVDLGGTIAFATGSMLDGSAIVTIALEATSRISGQVEWDATVVTGSTWTHQTGTTHTYAAGAVQLIDGTLTINAGGAFVVTGSHTAQSGSTTTFQSGSTTNLQGAVVRSGSAATTVWRIADLDNTMDANISVAVDEYRMDDNAALRTLTVDDTGAANGMQITVVHKSGAADLDIKRPDTTLIVTLGADWNSATITRRGGVWRLSHLSGALTTVGAGA